MTLLVFKVISTSVRHKKVDIVTSTLEFLDVTAFVGMYCIRQ